MALEYLHPMLVHFPIALVPIAVVLDWIAVALKRHDDMLRVAKALRTAGIPDQTLPQTD